MKRNLDQIRNNISRRKQLNAKKSHSFSLLDDEERYGHTSFPSSTDTKEVNRKQVRVHKLFLAVILFLTVLILEQTSYALLEKPKSFVQDALTEDLPFATVQAWYDDHFATSFLSFGRDKPYTEASQSDGTIPVSGIDQEDVKTFNEGVYIKVNEQKQVFPLERGTVIFAGTKPETGQTIILQHADGQKSVYGHLESIDVFHYQFVDEGNPIATVNPDESVGFTNMFFSVQDGEQFLDPFTIILGDSDE
ncbi:M23 family metallopeptidase [Halalkalibacillus sediminis]|nr:M23 family metallopeptidase [Halalkalibacillus sediminis]